MIFVVVGTHEQQFDRLVRAVDELQTEEERVVQYGYSRYVPIHCCAYNFLEFDEVRQLMNDADVVITHAGTGSTMLALSLKKRPIVAPRYARFGEHVDDHQLELVETLVRDGLVIPYFDGDSLAGRVREARLGAGEGRSIEPDPRLIAELREIIEGRVPR